MSLPYFPLYAKDFEAKTSHLTIEEDGAYNRLLRLCWMTPGCTLPDDDKWIMRRMRVDKDTYERVVLVVIEEFFDRKNGRVSNATLLRIFEETNEAHKKRVSAGSKGGKAKSLKNNDMTSSNATAMPKQPEPEPEPDIEKELSNDSSKKTPSASVVLKPKSDRQIFVEALIPILGDELANDIAKHRTKLKAPNTPRAATGLVNRLQKCPDPVFAANEMILRGWKSVEPEWLERSGRSPPGHDDEGSIYTRILERNGHFQ